MFKSILVPVDFTPKSATALNIAVSIARQCNGYIDLMNVVEVPLAVQAINDEYVSTASKGKPLLDHLMERSKRRLEKLRDKAEAPDIPVNIKIKVDPKPEKLAELITEKTYDLIVIGGITHPFDEFLQKTHPEKIVEIAKSPVLSVNGQISGYKPKNILLPTNLTDDYTKLMPNLKSFLKLIGGALHIVYINTPGQFKTTEEIELQIAQFKERHHLDNQTKCSVYSERTVKKGIMKFASKINADTITLFSKHQDNFLKIIRGDVTEFLVNHATIPVLTFNLKTMK